MTDQALLMRAADWTPEQKALYSDIAAVILRRNARGRRIVAVDGRDGAGKTRLADALQVAFAREGVEAFRASTDDFHNPQAIRHRQGRDSATGYYDDAFDYQQLLRVLLEPFRLGGSTGFVTRAFDVVADQPVEMQWRSAGPDAVLIVDGVFLQRPILRGQWHATIFVEASDEERGRRRHLRDGTHPLVSDPSHDRYRLAHERYEREAKPRSNATIVVDATDWRRPVEVFTDSC